MDGSGVEGEAGAAGAGGPDFLEACPAAKMLWRVSMTSRACSTMGVDRAGCVGACASSSAKRFLIDSMLGLIRSRRQVDELPLSKSVLDSVLLFCAQINLVSSRVR